MERCFIATKENKFIQDYEKYKSLQSKQVKFVDNFLKEKGIEGNEFIISGDGFVNIPFEEHNKSEITLSIKPTQNDTGKFGKSLKKPNKHHGLCGFKKNSVIAREFAQKCIDEQIVINLWKPRAGDYFNSIGYHGCSWEVFNSNDTFYLKIKSDYLKKDEIPTGLTEIKQSEYYQAREELENKAV